MLDVELANGFTPSDGESFDIISGLTTGNFTQLNLPSLSAGLRWDTSDLYTTGTISVVPEPSSVALFLVGTIGLVGWRWRQKRTQVQ
jgi:hypothetical protein